MKTQLTEKEFITQEEYAEILKGDDRYEKERFEKKEDGWHCRTCGALALQKTIAHPIWDGPIDGAGTGRCDYRYVPWCPNCNKDESVWESGKPIRIVCLPDKKAKVMRRLGTRLGWLP